jgi:2'-5' RNA ligase
MTEPYVDDLIRTFYALSVPPELVDAVRRIQQRARIDLPRGLRWTAPEQVHLTLAFLGDVPTESVVQLKSILYEIALSVEPFEVSVMGVGGFPRADRPRVVWAGLSGESVHQIGRLHHDLWSRLEPIVPKPEPNDREFHPHITLARVPGPQPPKIAAWMQRHADYEFGDWPVREIQLIQSVLTPKGPVYETLARSDLGDDMAGSDRSELSE